MGMVRDRMEIVTIKGLNHEGAGVGHLGSGLAVFVPVALPGEKVKIELTARKRNYALGRLMEIVAASPERVLPPCPEARACGGCHLQHLDYRAQLYWKRRMVTDALQRLGGLHDVRVLPVMGMTNPWGYRNKVRFHIAGGQLGFYRPGSHEVVSFSCCPLLPADLMELARGIARLLPGLPAGLRHVTLRRGWATGELLVALESEAGWTGGEGLAAALADRFPELVGVVALDGGVVVGDEQQGQQGPVDTTGGGYGRRVEISKAGNLPRQSMTGSGESWRATARTGNRDQQRHYGRERTDWATNSGRRGAGKEQAGHKTGSDRMLTRGRGNKVLYGRNYLEERLGGLRFLISAATFLQVNSAQAEVLYDQAAKRAALQGGEEILDAYCGSGAIALWLSRRAGRVTGVEVVPAAIADARRNAVINRISNVRFSTGAAEEVLPRLAGSGYRPEVVILDPPRAGCDRQVLAAVATMAPRRVVYVSCNPATLARDMANLRQAGFAPGPVQPVDMFPHTHHVECVVLMTNIKRD